MPILHTQKYYKIGGNANYSCTYTHQRYLLKIGNTNYSYTHTCKVLRKIERITNDSCTHVRTQRNLWQIRGIVMQMYILSPKGVLDRIAGNTNDSYTHPHKWIYNKMVNN